MHLRAVSDCIDVFAHSPNPHYESGAMRVAMNSEMVVKITALMEMNHFTVETTNLIKTSIGHCADNAVKDDLINVKELGLQALSDSVVDDQTRCPTEDLKTRICKLNEV